MASVRKKIALAASTTAPPVGTSSFVETPSPPAPARNATTTLHDEILTRALGEVAGRGRRHQDQRLDEQRADHLQAHHDRQRQQDREEIFEERRLGAGNRRQRRAEAVEQQLVVLADEQDGNEDADASSSSRSPSVTVSRLPNNTDSTWCTLNWRVSRTSRHSPSPSVSAWNTPISVSGGSVAWRLTYTIAERREQAEPEHAAVRRVERLPE